MQIMHVLSIIAVTPLTKTAYKMNSGTSHHRPPSVSQKNCSGFTLIELLIVITILGVLASLAYPSYTEYVQRGKLTEGTSTLLEFRLKMTQAYQDTRSYQLDPNTDDDTCAVEMPVNKDHFDFTCTAPTDRSFTITATSKGGVGLGHGNNFEYTVDQDGMLFTVRFNSDLTNEPCGRISTSICLENE